jgi:DNA-binding CsgD family transcriptional regulator/PAS domain-containing protein
VAEKRDRTSASEAAFNELLTLVYDAAIETELWTTVIERVADLLGGAGGALTEQDQRDGSGQGFFARADAAVVRDYFAYPYGEQVLLRVEDAEAFMRKWRPIILTDEDTLPKAELVRTAYYHEFLRRVDAHSVMTVRLMAEGFKATTLNIGRAPGAEQFGSKELELAGMLQPHLIRAVKLGKRVSGAQQLGEELAHFLDSSPYGLFLLNGDGQVRHFNRTGEKMVLHHDAISLAAGRLRAATPGVTNKLNELIVKAGKEPRVGGSMMLDSRSGRPPLSVIVAPVGAERLALFQAGPSVMVCITDLGAGVCPPEERLRDLFGLTRKEARVALALLEGASPREAAKSLGVSFYTVRGHLAQIFDKTGVRRQSEMVRLMLRAVGPQGDWSSLGEKSL